MYNNKKKGFMLIELVAVLIIMVIIVLILTLVMNIIRSARISADKYCIDAYGCSLELAIESYLLDTGKFPTDISQLKIECSGNETICSTTQLNSDSSIFSCVYS